MLENGIFYPNRFIPNRFTCIYWSLFEDNLRWRTFVGMSLMILVQMTGQPNILYYATDIFQAVGFCGDTLSAMATVGEYGWLNDELID